jgi:hypothetical protein
MLITAGIVTVIFGTQRIALVQFSQTSRQEDNINALYAAKAGIEDGLMRVRYNPDVETDKDKAFSFNLSSATAFDIGVKEPPDFSPVEAGYVMSIVYRKPYTGDWDQKGYAHLIAQDSALELKNFKDGDELYYRLWFSRGDAYYDSDSPPPPGSDTCFAQITVNDQTTRTTSREIFSYLYANNRGGTFLNDGTTGDDTYYFDSQKQNKNIDVTKNSSIQLFAVGCDVHFSAGVNNTGGNNTIDSLKTTITSTGYYGSAKRTLIAEVDRKTGTLLTVYEFTGYAGQNIKPVK